MMWLAEAKTQGRRWIAALALAAVSALSVAADEPSAAEKAVFMTPHLAGFKAPGVLHYNYRETAADQSPIEDTADLSIENDEDASYRVSARYLSGERQLALPVVSKAQSNPVILYFLEQDVRQMHADLGGATNYFRRHIRMALANSADVAPVQFTLDGAAHEGTRIRILPFIDVPKIERMKGQEAKQYEFIVSPSVPGGIYELRSGVPDKDGRLTHEITLTLNSEGS
ncbi:hypothetical protein [Nitrogeniibacter aestuarii]|uniref:hypothetical protein n=1 Tax=Nitrogeniibacter aestuarii TaxID=2815343 RepID=UPI001E36E629|nr:hypothetical protein [Nitrogeniibacter aestuarii]